MRTYGFFRGPSCKALEAPRFKFLQEVGCSSLGTEEEADMNGKLKGDREEPTWGVTIQRAFYMLQDARDSEENELEGQPSDSRTLSPSPTDRRQR